MQQKLLPFKRSSTTHTSRLNCRPSEWTRSCSRSLDALQTSFRQCRHLCNVLHIERFSWLETVVVAGDPADWYRTLCPGSNSLSFSSSSLRDLCSRVRASHITKWNRCGRRNRCTCQQWQTRRYWTDFATTRRRWVTYISYFTTYSRCGLLLLF